jgi:NAD(P)-dependent dehydrogenase (short-subunit alcohol dehydrogenase family)
MRLAGKVAVVTGGGSGIGQASAVLFAREGARVAVVDRDAAGVDATLSMIHDAGGEAIGCIGDVGLPGTADAEAARVLDLWDRIDILMTAAGISSGGTVLTTDPQAWDDVFRVNVGGTWLWARAVLPGMRQRGSGSIVTVASQLAMAGGRGNSAYIASKGAVVSLTRTMALDFAEDGIRVNAILPGATDTPMLRRSFGRREDPAAASEASRARHPMGRFGRVEEMAEAALYLASDAAGFTTGVCLPVDGGWIAG